MSDSDSGSESLDCGELRSRTQSIFGHDFPVLTFHLTEETYKSWNNIPLTLRKSHGQLLKICSFWLPMVLQRQRVNSATRWAMHVGFIDSVSSDLDLNHLYKIEALESVLRALDRGCVNLDRTKHLIWISNNLNLHVPEILDDALQWLFHTGEPKILEQVLDLGSKETLFVAIQYIFAEYAQFIQSMGVNADGMARALRVCHKEADVLKSDAMRSKGNTHFQRSEYEAAIKCYTDAIRYTPENHMIYGNRALCYIRCEKYLKAVGDGKRATLIEPLWPKGHYRYCEALFHLKEHRRAIDANSLARKVCIQTSEGLKDLVQQHKRFVVELAVNVGSAPREIKTKRQGRTSPATSLPPTATPAAKVDPKTLSGKAQHAKGKKTNPGVKEDLTPAVSNDKLPKQHKSETDKNWKDEPRVILIHKPERKGKDHSNEKLKTVSSVKNVPKSTKASLACIAALRSTVQDGYVALADLRCWLAEKAFSQALAMLQTATLKELGLSLLDEAVLRYGRASALIEICQPQELAEAQREFGIIKSLERRTFECLVYYGIGRVYFKENRFKDALLHFTDSMQMVNKRITPGKLTWPLTKEIVKETQLDYLKESLSELMESCKFPPEPDAICRQGSCIGHIKTAIYFTDPDFKGFIRLTCCHGCVVEYHISCWKSLKTTSFSDSNEKDFLQRDCLTPDCRAAICSIQIYGSTGLIKCKFETVIREPERPKKSKVNQKCTSLKKLQSKEERKLRRKQQKQAFKEAFITDGNVRQAEQDAARDKQPSQAAGPHSVPLHRDRVLFQMEQNRELLRGRRGDDLAALLARLQPWVELDRSRGNPTAARLLDVDRPQVETLGQIVDLLLERRNRVWARVLVEFLGGSLEWAQQLDNEGLSAALVFREKHAGHLEDLDPSCLLSFAPLQDVLVRKFDSRPELLSQSGVALTEYLSRASAQDVRVFIWTLEEHRDQYDQYHAMLDEFFDILDGDCLIMKKSDHVNENNSPTKTRNRGRKKKQKDQKAVIILSGMRGGTQRHEQDFFDDNEDSLSFFHSNDPFSVPHHLRDQVATFESHYNPPNHKSILDNNPDPTEESIYDYFAQTLEEHGPLDAQDPLLLGQLDHFPAEARQKMEVCGGLRSFLLQSLRFILIGEHVGLAKHAVSLQEAGRRLDALDVLEPQSAGLPPPHAYDHLCSLPCPYLRFGAEGAASPSGGDLDLYSAGAEANVWEDFTGQAYQADVVVNSANGYDANRARQPNQDLEEQVESLVTHLEEQERLHQLRVASLKMDIEETNTHIQVTNKEVEMFQQKLEEMVRRDQKEKKANHEELKALKTEMEELAGERARLCRSLQERRSEHDEQLRDFCDLSNQSAAEKMSLEDEIKRCHDLSAKAAMRSQKAELSILENTRKQSLYCLQKSLSDSRDILLKLEEVAPRYPAQVMALFQQRWRSCVLEATEKIAMVEAQYEEQMRQVTMGVRRSALPQISAPNAPEPPVAMTFSDIRSVSNVPQARHVQPAPSQHRPEAPAQARGPSPTLPRGPSPALPRGPSPALPRGPSPALPRGPSPAQAPQAPVHPPSSQRPRPLEPQQATRFDRILEHLGAMFPVYSRKELMKFIETFRRASGGALNSVNFQELVSGVSQIILDQQGAEYTTQLHPAGSRVWLQNGATNAPPPSAHVWQTLGPSKQCSTKALNTEDPCIICHDDMPPETACVLSCRHSFHRECIRSWLREQSTCPTCRKHALLPEDFPLLAGRRPTGRPAPSMS